MRTECVEGGVRREGEGSECEIRTDLRCVAYQMSML